MLWSFMYHKGPAHFYGCVETESSEEQVGLDVATAWCESTGCRPPASVKPMILADERILKHRSKVVDVQESLPNGVSAAETAGNTILGKLAGAFGR